MESSNQQDAQIVDQEDKHQYQFTTRYFEVDLKFEEEKVPESNVAPATGQTASGVKQEGQSADM